MGWDVRRRVRSWYMILFEITSLSEETDSYFMKVQYLDIGYLCQVSHQTLGKVPFPLSLRQQIWMDFLDCLVENWISVNLSFARKLWRTCGMNYSLYFCLDFCLFYWVEVPWALLWKHWEWKGAQERWTILWIISVFCLFKILVSWNEWK